jgi:NADPH-dependent ferric siderophore reductase
MSAVQPHAAPTRPAVDRVVTRVRHEVKMRRLEVRRSEGLSPSMVRLVLAGDDLAGFTSAGFDDHVKIFLPAPGAREPLLPTMGPKGLAFPEGAERPAARDFTPRKYDAEAGELTIDFVLHDAGPATAWAAQARPGDYLGVGGPRGSMIVPKDFRMHVLIGDETAIPAIARRLEELPGGVRARVFAEVEAPGHELNLESAAGSRIDLGSPKRRARGRSSPRGRSLSEPDRRRRPLRLGCLRVVGRQARALAPGGRAPVRSETHQGGRLLEARGRGCA